MVEVYESVQTENQTINLDGLKPYTLTWGPRSKTISLYEYDNVLMPEEPADEDCINYGLPQDDQIFRKTFIPPQVLNPYKVHEEPWTQEDIEAWIDREHQRRANGVWIFINGQKYWLPGGFYVFLNYWKLLSQQDIVFRFDALELWWIWIDTLRDPNWDGLIDFKCRQIGDTEFTIFMIWEYATRVRGVKCPLQSCLGDEHIQKTYDRLIYGNKNMIWFMKPINKGSETPADGIEFSYPVEMNTTKKLREKAAAGGSMQINSGEDYEYKELGSSILFGPYIERYFDGGTYGRAYIDEFGKAMKFDPGKLLKVYQPAINNRLIDKQVGKIIMTSTVEEMEGGKSLKWSKKLWSQAKPIIKPTGVTSLSRMRRIFRSALDRAPVDKFGIPKRAEERKWIEQTSKEYLESGDMAGMRIHERSNPLTIQQVFTSANDESQFDIDKLAKRSHYLHSDDYRNPKTGTNLKPWVQGNLRWKDDKKESGIAVWEPNSQGRWMIAWHPKDYGVPENAKVEGVWRSKPANTHMFRAAIDPFEQKKLVTDDWSMGGIAVKRLLDRMVDNDDESLYYQFNDESRGIKAGDPVDGGINFKTNRYCCVYLARPNNPEDFYEDCILTLLYYGCQGLPEKNKASGLLKHMDDRKYDLYKPDGVQLTKNAKGKSEEEAVTATEKSIDEYFGYLTTLSCKWANTIDLPWILEQLLTMNWENRGQKDLGVAVGWCEYFCKLPVYYKPKTTEQKASVYYEDNYV